MWWLSIHMRRLIAAILLLLDLSQEPGSGVSFASISDSDSDEVAELCTKENFSWSVAAAVEDAAPSSRDMVHGSPLFEQQSWSSNSVALNAQPTSVAVDFDAPGPTDAVPPAHLALPPPAYDRSVHRNTALAHKRDIVLIL